MEEARPQLTWISVITTIGVFGVVVGGFYKILEAQFDSINTQIALLRHDTEQLRDALTARILVLEAEQRSILSRSARSPVETQQVNDLSHTIDVRMQVMQGQIDDINKQIAAAIIRPTGK